MDTGQKIKALRTQKGMTLEALGKLVGVGKSTVRKWETGAIENMGRDKIAKLSEVFGVSPTYFINDTENDPEPFYGEGNAERKERNKLRVDLLKCFDEMTPEMRKMFLAQAEAIIASQKAQDDR